MNGEMHPMKETIRSLVLELGADVCGFAQVDRFIDAPAGFHPADLFSRCRTVIALGLAIPDGLLHVDSRLIYGYYNEFICQKVDEIALEAARLIERQHGCRAVPLPCDSPYEYWDAEKMEGRGLLSMKHAAVLAGLGTLGKSTLLLNVQYGNRLTVGAILTNLELESDSLAEPICIEGCNQCIKHCPSQALDGTRVDQKKCRTYTYGKTARGFSTTNCNVCRVVCPLASGKARS
jgi:epoxyqueuosine reductase QueG